MSVKFWMDFHTHTIASGHGFSTLQENITAAQAKGLKYLGYSEHGPKLPGGPHPLYYGNMKVLPREFGDLRLFCGVEANILDCDGSLDLSDEQLSKLEYCIASLHIPCCKPGSEKENTQEKSFDHINCLVFLCLYSSIVINTFKHKAS